MNKYALVVLAVSFGGCAASNFYDGSLPPPDGTVVHAYHSVRAAGATAAHAGGLVFCATANGLEAIRSEPRGSDNWAAKLEDSYVKDTLRHMLRTDPELRGEPIHAEIVKGEAFLYGNLSSDQRATLAVYDALRVAGVMEVNAAFITPESPAPMAVRAVGSCE